MSRSIPEPTLDLLRRFWSKVDKTEHCWHWTGGKQTRGYGSFGVGPRGEVQTFLAHRVAWTWANGPIPDGMTVDHLCMNKTCQRTDHMELVDRSTNSARGNGWDQRLSSRVLRGEAKPLAAEQIRAAELEWFGKAVAS